MEIVVFLCNVKKLHPCFYGSFTYVSVHFCFGWVLSFLSIDLMGPPQCLNSGSDSEPVVIRGLDFPIDFSRYSAHFLSSFMDFLPICYNEPVCF